MAARRGKGGPNGPWGLHSGWALVLAREQAHPLQTAPSVDIKGATLVPRIRDILRWTAGKRLGWRRAGTVVGPPMADREKNQTTVHHETRRLWPPSSGRVWRKVRFPSTMSLLRVPIPAKTLFSSQTHQSRRRNVHDRSRQMVHQRRPLPLRGNHATGSPSTGRPESCRDGFRGSWRLSRNSSSRSAGNWVSWRASRTETGWVVSSPRGRVEAVALVTPRIAPLNIQGKGRPIWWASRGATGGCIPETAGDCGPICSRRPRAIQTPEFPEDQGLYGQCVEERRTRNRVGKFPFSLTHHPVHRLSRLPGSPASSGTKLPGVATRQWGSPQNPPDLGRRLPIAWCAFGNTKRKAKGRPLFFFSDACRPLSGTPLPGRSGNLREGGRSSSTAPARVLFTKKNRGNWAKNAQKGSSTACPYNIPSSSIKRTGVLVKCDMCFDRIDAGLEPICAKTCPHRRDHLRRPGIRHETGRYSAEQGQEQVRGSGRCSSIPTRSGLYTSWAAGPGRVLRICDILELTKPGECRGLRIEVSPRFPENGPGHRAQPHEPEAKWSTPIQGRLRQRANRLKKRLPVYAEIVDWLVDLLSEVRGAKRSGLSSSGRMGTAPCCRKRIQSKKTPFQSERHSVRHGEHKGTFTPFWRTGRSVQQGKTGPGPPGTCFSGPDNEARSLLNAVLACRPENLESVCTRHGADPAPANSSHAARPAAFPAAGIKGGPNKSSTLPDGLRGTLSGLRFPGPNLGDAWRKRTNPAPSTAPFARPPGTSPRLKWPFLRKTINPKAFPICMPKRRKAWRMDLCERCGQGIGTIDTKYTAETRYSCPGPTGDFSPCDRRREKPKPRCTFLNESRERV